MKKYFILLLTVAAVLTAMLSCGQGQQSAEKQSEADSLLVAVWNAGDYERVIVIADSLDQTGDISPMKSAYYQGGAYAMQNHLRHAEEVLKPVKDMTPTTSQDSACYIDCLCIMAGIYNVRDDYEGVLEGAPFYGESIEDIRNHQLLVYTDGLNEAENTQHELLGDDRLLELMADAQSLDSHQLIGMMKEAVEQHRNGADPSDDLTLMYLKIQ